MFNKKRFIKKLDNLINKYKSDPSVNINKELNALRNEAIKSNCDSGNLKNKIEVIRLIVLAWELFKILSNK